MSATLLIARRELGGYFRSMTGYIIAGLRAAGRRHALQRVRARAQARCTRPRCCRQLLLHLVRHHLHRQRLHLDAPARRGAPDRDAGPADVVAGPRLGDRPRQVSCRRWSSWPSSRIATIYMPALIFVNGKVSLGHLFAGYLGLLLRRQRRRWRSASFGSALARNQMLAVIFSAVITLVIVLSHLAGAGDGPAAQGHVHVAGAVRAALPALPDRRHPHP